MNAVPEGVANRSFVAPRGWHSGHLQTVRSKVLPSAFDLDLVSSERQILVDVDQHSGDQLAVSLHRSHRFEQVSAGSRGRTALVVLVHGLGGSAESDYVRSTAHGLLQMGWNVARVDLRGAGQSKPHSFGFYHAGRTDDLRNLLQQLASQPEALLGDGGGAGLGIVGFSLGGNQVIKLMSEPLEGVPLMSGAAVSAPLDLAVGSEHLHHMAFGLYEKYLLGALKRDSLQIGVGGRSRVSASERVDVQAARNIVDFDNAITAPRNGWSDAEEYYRVNSSGQFLPEVARPLLVVHSLDDPMIPAGPYRAIDWTALAERGWVQRAITEVGGHVGFHQRGRRHRWFVPLIGRFMARAGER